MFVIKLRFVLKLNGFISITKVKLYLLEIFRNIQLSIIQKLEVSIFKDYYILLPILVPVLWG